MSDEDEDSSSSSSSDGESTSSEHGNRNMSLLEVALPQRRSSRNALPVSESESSSSSSSSSSSDASSSETDEAKRKDEWKYRRRKKSPPDKTTTNRMAKANNNQSNGKPSSDNCTTSEKYGDDPQTSTEPKRRKSLIRASRLEQNTENNLGTRSWNKNKDAPTVNSEEVMEPPLKEEEEERVVKPEAGTSSGGIQKTSPSERYHTPEQMRIMLDFYRQKHYPSKEDFLVLEQRTGLSPKKLLYWFSNRRRRKNDLAKETPNPRGRRPHSSTSAAMKAELLPPLLPSVATSSHAEETTAAAAVLSDPDDQKFFMVQFFKTNPYPTREEMRQIGERIGLTEKKVFYWFSNRRRKEKPEGFVSRKQPQQPKDEGEGSASASGLSPERPPRPKLEAASSGPGSDSSRTPSPAKRERFSSPVGDLSHQDSSFSTEEREGGGGRGGESLKLEEAESSVSDAADPGLGERPKKMADMKIEVAEGAAIGDASAAPRYSCRLCKYVTETGRGNLLRHFRDTHKMKPKFCKRCRLVYLKDAAFKSHAPCYDGRDEVKAEEEEDSDDPEISFSSSSSSPEKAKAKQQQQKPQFYSQRYKTLLDRLGSKSRKDQSVDEVAAGSPFQRNGKLELVMVTQGQFNAVQDFIGGDDARV